MEETPKKTGPVDFLIRQLYTCCGLGLIPKAPGTFGTLMGIPLYFLVLKLWPGNLWVYLAAVAIVFFVGWWACERAEKDFGKHDDKRVVIDEALGYLVTMFPIPFVQPLPLAFVWGFLLFRFYDIAKPGPVGAIDRKTPGGLGVMADDLVAGIFAWATMFVIALAVAFFRGAPGGS
ncbi:MAG: phosphatidylglycerophosphatase A [Deltaproteobacteria bacterium]|jgi:phosphatidylglycerophosphatase A|nr:phosphatidylglycerophosphatase A [Deltaproteobacteria bacterium]